MSAIGIGYPSMCGSVEISEVYAHPDIARPFLLDWYNVGNSVSISLD
jgi:hypothetical protein